MTTTTAPTIRQPSAVALTALIADVASHADDSGAHVQTISCATGFLFDLPDAPYYPNGIVSIQTDGPGFLALVDHFGLTVTAGNGPTANVSGSGYVGLLEIPVYVYSGLTETLAAGLATA